MAKDSVPVLEIDEGTIAAMLALADGAADEAGAEELAAVLGAALDELDAVDPLLLEQPASTRALVVNAAKTASG